MRAGDFPMDGKVSRFRSTEWLQGSFWADVEAELARIEPVELACFARADREPLRAGFERELWRRLEGLLPI